MGAHVCAHVYLITPFCARLLLGVLRALSFEPFARLSLPSLEIELWSPRVVDFYRHTCVSAHMPLIPPSLWPSTAIIRSFQVNNSSGLRYVQNLCSGPLCPLLLYEFDLVAHSTYCPCN